MHASWLCSSFSSCLKAILHVERSTRPKELMFLNLARVVGMPYWYQIKVVSSVIASFVLAGSVLTCNKDAIQHRASVAEPTLCFLAVSAVVSAPLVSNGWAPLAPYLTIHALFALACAASTHIGLPPMIAMSMVFISFPWMSNLSMMHWVPWARFNYGIMLTACGVLGGHVVERL